MAVANITNNFVIPEINGTTELGMLLFSNGSLKSTNYVLNRIGKSYSLSINPVMIIFGNQNILTSPSPFSFLNNTITNQIPLIVSDTSGTQSNTIGVITITNATITVYASIQGTPFNADGVNYQGWQNSIMINFSV